MKSNVRAALACGALALPALVHAAEPTAPRRHVLGNTELRDLPRAANGRDYMLYVALPYSYGRDTGKRYPVIYICDGYWDFTLLNGFYGNLIYDRVIPELIIVGIGYQGEKPDYESLRRYDLTPAPDPDKDPRGQATGHAADFLGVVEKEIVPFVEKEYRVDSSYRVLGGSSLGGLFTLYALFERPGLFQAYVAPSPAAGWAADWLFHREEAFARSGQKLKARLFMTGAANEWPEFLGHILRFNARLEHRGHEGLVYEWRLVDGERHTGTKAESYNRGLRFAFAPRAPRD
jgi:predicted alpha/beta superfamily hydrolase